MSAPFLLKLDIIIISCNHKNTMQSAQSNTIMHILVGPYANEGGLLDYAHVAIFKYSHQLL